MPIVVEIPGGLDLGSITITFNYSDYPTGSTASKTEPPQDGDGAIRIWRKNGKTGRNGWDADVTEAGEYGDHYPNSIQIPGKRFDFKKNAGGNWEVELYVEGVIQSQTIGKTIKATLAYTPQGGSQQNASDEVRYVVGYFLVHGKITYGNDNPVRHALVTVEDVGAFGTDVVVQIYTDKYGNYSFYCPINKKNTIGYMTVFTYSDELLSRRVSVTTNSMPSMDGETGAIVFNYDCYKARFFDAYHISDDQNHRNASMVMEVNCHIDDLENQAVSSYKRINDTTRKAFYVYDPMVTGAQIHNRLSGARNGHITAIFPWWNPPILDFRSFAYLGATHIMDANYADWDTIIHEYGHVVAQQAGFFDLDFNHLDHRISENVRTTQSHECKHCTHLGFSEGWANFYSMYAKKNGDTISGVSKNDFYGFDPNTSDQLLGEDQEIAVMRLLWDIHKTTGINGLYDILRGADGGAVLWNTTDLWQYMTCEPTGPNYLNDLKKLGVLFAEQGIGVKNIRSTADGSGWKKDSTPPTFNWDLPESNSGGTMIKLFDRFRVAFYDENGFSLGLSDLIISPVTGTWTPSVSKWQGIVQKPSGEYRLKVYWTVLCSKNFDNAIFFGGFESGCYWSDDYHIVNITN